MPSAQKTYLASHAAPTRRPIAAMKAARPRQFAIKALTRDHAPPARPVLTRRNRSSRAPSHCWTGHASSQRGLGLKGEHQSIAATASRLRVGGTLSPRQPASTLARSSVFRSFSHAHSITARAQPASTHKLAARRGKNVSTHQRAAGGGINGSAPRWCLKSTHDGRQPAYGYCSTLYTWFTPGLTLVCTCVWMLFSHRVQTATRKHPLRRISREQNAAADFERRNACARAQPRFASRQGASGGFRMRSFKHLFKEPWFYH